MSEPPSRRSARRGWAVILVAASGCNASSAASCDELRAELASLDVPTAADAWEDIAVLQEDVSRALSLQASIEQRCGEGG